MIIKYGDRTVCKKGGVFMKKLFGAFVSFVLAFGSVVSYAQEPSKWADMYITQAQDVNIISDKTDYEWTAPITRETFCDIAFSLLNKVSGLEEYSADTAVFSDTDNHKIEALYEIGIINGKSITEFAPNDGITREEAAAILNKSSEYLKIENNTTQSDYRFVDDEAISQWAKEDVYDIYNLGIMNGIGEEKFAPQGSYTVEQTIATMLRLYYIYVNKDLTTEKMLPLFGEDKNAVLEKLGINVDNAIRTKTDMQEEWYVDGSDSFKVCLIFYNDVFMGYKYLFNDWQEAFEYAVSAREDVGEILGEKTTYPGLPDESKFDNIKDYTELEEMMTVYEDWTPETNEEQMKKMLGDREAERIDIRFELSVLPQNMATLTVRYQVLPQVTGESAE